MSANTVLVSDAKGIYSDEELSRIDSQKVPKHVAIIMDGNRRWAQHKNLPPIMGHWEGAETLSEIVKSAVEIGVKVLTVFAFSTENWSRDQKEVEDLMNIFELYLMRKKEFMVREGVRLGAIGDVVRLPKQVLDAFESAKNATEHCDRIELILALNYGGRDEIRRAMVKVIEEKIPASELTEECIAKHLDTHAMQDPDLLIRTSGEMRVSNFLLWQISYTEIFSTDVMWPDFSSKEFYKAVLEYQKRCRRLGG